MFWGLLLEAWAIIQHAFAVQLSQISLQEASQEPLGEVQAKLLKSSV